MYKGIAGSEGIGIGKVVLIEEHDLTVEKKSVTDTDAELKRLQDAIEKFVSITMKWQTRWQRLLENRMLIF